MVLWEIIMTKNAEKLLELECDLFQHSSAKTLTLS